MVLHVKSIMTENELIMEILLYVKNWQNPHKSCELSREYDELPEQFKHVNGNRLEDCVRKLINELRLLDGQCASNGASHLRLTSKGEAFIEHC